MSHTQKAERKTESHKVTIKKSSEDKRTFNITIHRANGKKTKSKVLAMSTIIGKKLNNA